MLHTMQDKTIQLWDSRYECEEEDDGEGGMKEPLILLATFDNPERWVHVSCSLLYALNILYSNLHCLDTLIFRLLGY